MNKTVYWFRIQTGFENILSVIQQLGPVHYYNGSFSTGALDQYGWCRTTKAVVWTASLSPRTRTMLSLSITGYEEITMFSDVAQVIGLIGITGMDSLRKTTGVDHLLASAIKQDIYKATFIS